MMAYYILFIAAGGAGIFVGVAYILGGDISQNILRMDLESMKLALGGTVFTLIFQVQPSQGSICVVFYFFKAQAFKLNLLSHGTHTCTVTVKPLI